MDVRPTAEWDLSESLAEIQETYLAPAMYAQWAIRLTAMAHIDSCLLYTSDAADE